MQSHKLLHQPPLCLPLSPHCVPVSPTIIYLKRFLYGWFPLACATGSASLLVLPLEEQLPMVKRRRKEERRRREGGWCCLKLCWRCWFFCRRKSCMLQLPRFEPPPCHTFFLPTYLSPHQYIPTNLVDTHLNETKGKLYAPTAQGSNPHLCFTFFSLTNIAPAGLREEHSCCEENAGNTSKYWRYFLPPPPPPLCFFIPFKCSKLAIALLLSQN